MEDLYTTVLYNDEVHTFDEVITTLQRAVDNCDRNQAIRFLTFSNFADNFNLNDQLEYTSVASMMPPSSTQTNR